ncbi:NAD(P)(+) transhydrogenase (AB-specific), partial [mine drainage metagenome]
GYARELTPEEKAQEKEMVAKAVAEADVIVTTAAIPGRKAPVLVTREMVERMRPGAVLVDLAAESGGNCELTRPGETVSVHGVTLVGPLNLPSQLPYHASQMFAKNLQAFLTLLITKEGTLVTDFSDEILAQSLLVSGGEVRHAPTQKLLEGGA